MRRSGKRPRSGVETMKEAQPEPFWLPQFLNQKSQLVTQKGAVKLKTWQLLFCVPNLNWYQRQSFNLVCIANKPHHFEGKIEAKTCHENHSVF